MEQRSSTVHHFLLLVLMIQVRIAYVVIIIMVCFKIKASSKVRRGMTFEIDDLKFHLEAMKSPDYQPLVESKKMIEELQEKIKLLNIELTTKRKHNEQIQKEIYGNIYLIFNTITVNCCVHRNT